MELSQYDEMGAAEEYPNWPFMVELEPYNVYGWTDKYQNDFTDQLKLLKPNTAIFKLLAYDKPPELGGYETLCGYIVSRSKTVTSLWADKHLFF